MKDAVGNENLLLLLQTRLGGQAVRSRLQQLETEAPAVRWLRVGVGAGSSQAVTLPKQRGRLIPGPGFYCSAIETHSSGRYLTGQDAPGTSLGLESCAEEALVQ
jgi:hypothetical protein